MEEVTVKAPATVANIVCGFDILGMALNEPYDEFTLRRTTDSGIIIKNIDSFNLPVDPVKNVSGAALQAFLDELKVDGGLELVSNKSVMPGSGIGSSASSAAGVVVAANHLFGNPFSKEKLIEFAMCGEFVASGAKHADNIAPCIYGGVTLIRSNDPLDIIPLQAPPMFVTVIHPQIEVKTSDARQILKKQIALKDAIIQWGNVAGLVAGFLQGNYQLIGRSLSDVIIEPVRSILIPGFNDIKIQSKGIGALGGGISGSGPSVFMLSVTEEIAFQVKEAMSDIYSKMGIDFHIHVTTLNTKGVEIIK